MHKKEDILEDIKKLLILQSRLEAIESEELVFKVLDAQKLNRISRQSVISHLNSLIIELGKYEVSKQLNV